MKLSFNLRNRPLYPELRVFYKMAQIVLVLRLSSRGKKSSLIRLHLFNWALNEDSSRTMLLKFSSGTKNVLEVWSIDPMLNQAIEYAMAEHLIQKSGNSYEITPNGEKFCDGIIEQKLLERDVEYLSTIGKKVSEVSVNAITNQWR